MKLCRSFKYTDLPVFGNDIFLRKHRQPEFLVFTAADKAGGPQFEPLARERGQRAKVAKKGTTFDGILRFCELAAALNTLFGSRPLKRLSGCLQKADV